MKILVVNGPNLNMLGKREPDVYGKETLNDLCDFVKKDAESKGIDVSFFQSNFEGALIDKIQVADEYYDGIIINPAAYTHYSYAILDALKSISIPSFEVHISDISKRESFRHLSVTKEGCIGQISGFGFNGYIMALDKLSDYINEHV
jgi:3-dehydroquinate dehydratase II